MQLMAERGREFETVDGLGWIKGEVAAITPGDPALKIPHMGWNELAILRPHPVLDGIEAGAHAYFVHSYGLVLPRARRSAGDRRLRRRRSPPWSAATISSARSSIPKRARRRGCGSSPISCGGGHERRAGAENRGRAARGVRRHRSQRSLRRRRGRDRGRRRLRLARGAAAAHHGSLLARRAAGAGAARSSSPASTTPSAARRS